MRIILVGALLASLLAGCSKTVKAPVPDGVRTMKVVAVYPRGQQCHGYLAVMEGPGGHRYTSIGDWEGNNYVPVAGDIVEVMATGKDVRQREWAIVGMKKEDKK